MNTVTKKVIVSPEANLKGLSIKPPNYLIEGIDGDSYSIYRKLRKMKYGILKVSL